MAGAGPPARRVWENYKEFHPYVLQLWFSRRHITASIFHKHVPSEGQGRLVASASTKDSDISEILRDNDITLTNHKAASLVGSVLAQRAKPLPMTNVHLDIRTPEVRGRVKAMLEALRLGGVPVNRSKYVPKERLPPVTFSNIKQLAGKPFNYTATL